MKLPPIIRLRGIRQVIPTGYVIGRIDPGEGDAQLIPISRLSDAAAKTGIVMPAGATQKVGQDAGLWLAGGANIFDGQYYQFAPASVDLVFPSATLTSLAFCTTAATTSTARFWITNSIADFTANEGAGLHNTHRIDFAAASLTGVVTKLNSQTITRGQNLFVVVDTAYNDTTLAGIQFVLSGDPA